MSCRVVSLTPWWLWCPRRHVQELSRLTSAAGRQQQRNRRYQQRNSGSVAETPTVAGVPATGSGRQDSCAMPQQHRPHRARRRMVRDSGSAQRMKQMAGLLLAVAVLAACLGTGHAQEVVPRASHGTIPTCACITSSRQPALPRTTAFHMGRSTCTVA